MLDIFNIHIEYHDKFYSCSKLKLKKLWKPSIVNFTNGETNKNTVMKSLATKVHLTYFNLHFLS